MSAFLTIVLTAKLHNEQQVSEIVTCDLFNQTVS